ncbi:MAG: diaminopimelate epimerase [Firmicutes bacterium]|nr:diaminopimelate epimerase [Bacillota bacterium]
MKLDFVKMQGCGNDYIYIDNLDNGHKIEAIKECVVSLSDRHFGVGGDGVVVVCPSTKATAKMVMYNADGSLGKMCGNAIRCVAKWLHQKGLVQTPIVRIETDDGVKRCELQLENTVCKNVRVDMGVPRFCTDTILRPKYASAMPQCIGKKMEIEGSSFVLSLVSIGNPHSVLFVQDTQTCQVEPIGKKLQESHLYADSTNVEFVQVIDKHHLALRVYERGSGETLACGTGACAAVAVAIRQGFCGYDTDIVVSLTGGDLVVKQTNHTIFLSGGCETVFVGSVEIEQKIKKGKK